MSIFKATLELEIGGRSIVRKADEKESVERLIWVTFSLRGYSGNRNARGHWKLSTFSKMFITIRQGED